MISFSAYIHAVMVGGMVPHTGIFWRLLLPNQSRAGVPPAGIETVC